MSPIVTATVEPSQLVVAGEHFGTECNDAGQGSESRGVLGPPATDISLIVRQQGDEWVVALGDADADYTFNVEVDLPPMEGSVTVEAREGVPSQVQAVAEVTLPVPDPAHQGTTTVSFGKQSADGKPVSENSSSGVPLIAIAPLVGGFCGVVGIHWWLRRKTVNRT